MELTDCVLTCVRGFKAFEHDIGRPDRIDFVDLVVVAELTFDVPDVRLVLLVNCWSGVSNSLRGDVDLCLGML